MPAQHGMNQHMQRTGQPNAYHASPHPAAAGAAFGFAWRLPVASRQCKVSSCGPHQVLKARQSRGHAHVLRAAADEDSAAMTPEEEAAYEAYRQQQREARQQKRSEYKRRRSFDPLASRYAEKGGSAVSAAPAGTATPAGSVAPAGAPSATAPAASRQAAAGGANAGPRSGSNASAGSSRPASPPRAMTPSAPTAGAGAGGAAAAARPRVAPSALNRRQRQATAALAPPMTSPAPRSTSADDADDAEEAIDFEAIVRDELAMESVPEARVLPAKAPRRRTPAQLKAGAAGRMLAKEAQQETMAQLAALQRAAAAASGDDSDADEDDGDDDDELDWDALGKYESFEAYVSEQKREQAAAAARDAARRSSSSASSSSSVSNKASSSSSTSNASRRAGGSGASQSPAARARAVPRARTSPAMAAGAAAAARAAAVPTAGADREAGAVQLRQAKQPAAQRKDRGAGLADGKSKLERELDEMEQLVGFFEALEREGSGAAAGNRLQRRQRAPGSAVEGQSWEAVEKLLLGEGWEEEVWAALAEEDEEAQAINGQEAGTTVGGAETAAIEEGQPWEDEVTALLLGLVTISHKKYLAKPLHDRPVSEDERAAFFWNFPQPLLMHDDSPQARIEYANAAACKLFCREYLDMFGLPSHELVAPDPSAQEEWAFALKDAEEGFRRWATLPVLEMVNAKGERVMAKDVLVWRVDSLEDDAIGQAVLIKDPQAL